MTDKQSPGFVNAIGNTPLIRLQGVSELSGCDIYGKAEFMNPGGSVKAVSYTHLTLPTKA